MEREVAQRLVMAWHQDSHIFFAVRLGLLEAGIVPDIAGIHDQLRLEFIPMITARPFFASAWPVASDMLWDGKADDAVVDFIMKHRAQQRQRNDKELSKERRRIKPVRFVNARSLGRTSDWKLCK